MRSNIEILKPNQSVFSKDTLVLSGKAPQVVANFNSSCIYSALKCLKQLLYSLSLDIFLPTSQVFMKIIVNIKTP